MDKGRCAKPRPTGAACHTAVDALASYAGQEDLELRHPQCAGYCAVRRCADAKPLGAACKTAAQCGPDARCAAGVCVAGTTAPAGAACTGGGCEPGTRCIADRCVAPQAKGAACRIDQECRGACVREAGADVGTCGTRCQLEL
jgi:hypothetical protein